MTISRELKFVKNSVVDAIDKASGPTSRAGVTVERIAKMAKAGVSSRTIATQLADNSHTGQIYTAGHIDSFKMLFTDVQTKVGVTAAQAQAMINDQQSTKDADMPTDVAWDPS
jgi:hypothetical protein